MRLEYHCDGSLKEKSVRLGADESVIQEARWLRPFGKDGRV